MRDALGRLHGSLAALPTPFRDGAVDLPALEALCERQIRGGTRALVICGSTGEAPALLPTEFAAAVRAAVRMADGRVPVIAGCSAPATETATELAAIAARCGADALLCAAPAYVRPGPAGIYAHVRAVAHAASCPVMLYDVPARTGVAIPDESIAALFERGLIWALKDASGDLARVPRLRAACGKGLLQFSGEDATAIAHRAMGGDGCVSVTANLVPALCARMHEAWNRGDLCTAAALRDRLAPLHEALFAESNPIPLKAALAQLGLCGPELRLPLTQAQPATRHRLAVALETLMPRESALAARPARLALVG